MVKKLKITFVLDLDADTVKIHDEETLMSHDKVTILDALADVRWLINEKYEEVLRTRTYGRYHEKDL